MDLLEDIVNNSSGNLRIAKLLSLSKSPLSAQARSLALKFIKEGRDVDRYLENYHDIEPLDQEWVDQTKRKNRQDIEKLEEELRTYKSNHIKESIRMAYMDLGDIYVLMSDYSSALKSFNRAKDYCTTPTHNMEIYMKVIHVNLMTCSWQQMTLQISKAESILDIPEKYSYNSKLKCYQGIVFLCTEKYAQAANVFLSLDFQVIEGSNDVKD
jgi:COP9 signalosome complex subunit 1